MKILNLSKLTKSASLVAVLSIVGAGASAQAAGNDPAGTVDSYEWSAQMVAFDEAANLLTLKARVASHSGITGLEDFSDGDRLTLVWSGRHWASGIRDIAADPNLDAEALRMPIEFVDADSDGRYVTFRVPVPEASKERISEIVPGSRVTGMSPRGDSDWNGSVVSLRHYNDVDR